MLKPSVVAIALIALTASVPVHATTQTISFTKTVTFDDLTATVSGILNLDTNANTLSGTITVTVMNNTSGETIFSKTFNINLTFSSNSQARMVLGSLNMAVSCQINASTGSSGCIFTGDPDANHDGSVNLADAAMLAFAYGSVSTSSNYNPSVDLNMDGRISLLDASILAADYGVRVYY